MQEVTQLFVCDFPTKSRFHGFDLVYLLTYMLYVYLFSKVWYFEWSACETLEISAVRVLHETNHSSTRIFPWFYRNLILLLFSLWCIRIAHFILWEQDWNMQKSRIPNSKLNFSTLDMYMYLFYYVVTQSTDDML